MHKVSIVIPFYNGDDYIDKCLESLSIGSCAEAEKIIVNNSDRATRIDDIAARYENVTVFDAKPRIGFGRACNEGAQISILRGAEYIIFLNQDSIAHEDLVLQLIAPFAESRELVITAPIHYNYDFSSIDKTFILYLSKCPHLLYDALNIYMRSWYNCDCISGACFAIRSEYINKYGLFDPVYFMYWEDNDLCRKVRYLNYGIALVPGAKIGHFNHAGDNYKEIHKVQMWSRHSMSIFELKDVKVSLLRQCLYICRSSIKAYLNYGVSLRFLDLLFAILFDIRLLVSLPHIIRSRNAERNLISASVRI